MTDFRDQYKNVKDYYKNFKENFKENRAPHSLTPDRRRASQLSSGKSHSEPIPSSTTSVSRGRTLTEIRPANRQPRQPEIRVRSPSRVGMYIS